CRLPAALGLPDVPDPGDVALIEQRIADRTRWIVCPQPRQKPVAIEFQREEIGPERGEPLIEPGAALRHQLEQRSIELDDIGAASAQDKPRSRRRSSPTPT